MSITMQGERHQLEERRIAEIRQYGRELTESERRRNSAQKQNRHREERSVRENRLDEIRRVRSGG